MATLVITREELRQLVSGFSLYVEDYESTEYYALEDKLYECLEKVETINIVEV